MSTVCVGHKLESSKICTPAPKHGVHFENVSFYNYLASLLTNKVQVLQEQQEKASVQQ